MYGGPCDGKQVPVHYPPVRFSVPAQEEKATLIPAQLALPGMPLLGEYLPTPNRDIRGHLIYQWHPVKGNSDG